MIMFTNNYWTGAKKMIELNSRCFFDTWEDTTGKRHRYTKRIGTLPYVRRLIKYKEQGYKLVPVEFKEWTQQMHDYFIGRQFPFEPEPTIRVPLEIKAYLKLRDAQYHALVRFHNGDLKALVQEQKWMEILQRYPGRVDPGVLFSFCTDPEVIILAKVLFTVHEAMKRHRVLWLSEDRYRFLLEPHFTGALATGVTERLITISEDRCITLTWAYKASLKAPHPLPTFIHTPGAELLDVQEWDGKQVEFDFERSVASFLDQGKLPVSMLCEIQVPYVPPALLTQRDKLDGIRAKIKPDERVLLVEGIIWSARTMDPEKASLVKSLKRFSQEYGIGEIFVMRWKYGGKMELKKPGVKPLLIPNSAANEYLLPASLALPEDLPYIGTNAYDRVVVMTRGLDLREWKSDCERVAKEVIWVE